MNRRPFILASLIAALSALTPTDLWAQDADSAKQSIAAYHEGRAAEKAGDAAAAKKAYEAALRHNPKNANARYQLGQLKLNYAKVAARGREAKFSSVVIPEFAVADATLRDALSALAILTEQASKKEVSPNFIIQDSNKQLADRQVSLKMKNTPAGGVLKYLLELTQSKARFDEHATVVSPR